MKGLIVAIRNSVIHLFYSGLLKPFFFARDPEDVHDRMVRLGAFLGRFRLFRLLTAATFGYSHPMLEQEVLGMHFKNPIGLAAGFDKNAELTDILPSVGFGFEEVGSITGNPSKGNPRPRLWRLPKSKGLVVYYGLKNDGAEVISHKLARKRFGNRVGINVAMTNCEENLDIRTAVLDYAKAFRAFTDIGDYFTINISCPNAKGGQPFVAPHRLDYLLDILDEIPTKKPVFIKLSPDISFEVVDELLDVAKKHRVHGIICTNLTKKRNNPKIIETDLPDVGGISGKPVQDLSDKLLAYIYRRERERFVLIGLGGVFSAEDAYTKIRLGASLVQLVTGMIFEGPQVISEINRGLVRLLTRDGFVSVQEARGVDSPAGKASDKVQ